MARNELGQFLPGTSGNAGGRPKPPDGLGTREAAPSPRAGPALLGRRAVVFDADAIDCPVYRRDSLAAGERIDGPAIIQEYASTVILFPEDRAEVMTSGELLIQVGCFE